MGTFGGHALPGSFFIVFALWWTWKAFKRYYRCQAKGQKYWSTITFPVDCSLKGCLSNLEWEGIFKLFFTSVGFAGEIITGFKDGHFSHFGNGQHATMYFFFGLSGAIDILVHHGASLPKNIEYAIGILCFVVEDVLFMFHLHGRNPLDVLIHTLLVYTLHGCVLISTCELIFRNSLMVTLTRCFLVLQQGTWFWQAGIILYKPLTPWKEDDHKEMMLVTMIFTWHVAINFIIIMMIGLVVKMTLPCCSSPGEKPINNVLYKQVKTSNKPDNGLANDSDSASEVEFIVAKP